MALSERGAHLRAVPVAPRIVVARGDQWADVYLFVAQDTRRGKVPTVAILQSKNVKGGKKANGSTRYMGKCLLLREVRALETRKGSERIRERDWSGRTSAWDKGERAKGNKRYSEKSCSYLNSNQPQGGIPRKERSSGLSVPGTKLPPLGGRHRREALKIQGASKNCPKERLLGGVQDHVRPSQDQMKGDTKTKTSQDTTDGAGRGKIQVLDTVPCQELVPRPRIIEVPRANEEMTGARRMSGTICGSRAQGSDPTTKGGGQQVEAQNPLPVV